MKSLFERAQAVIPGGVNSPVRACRSVDADPIYATRGEGAVITTAEGQQLIDFCGSWGPLILGHAHPEVIDAITRTAANGTSFGINTPDEVELAETICRLIPEMDRVRLVSSGTEAVMTALRLARGVTGRRKLLKFDGCYHGHTDSMLVAAGSGLLTGGLNASAGVSAETAADTFVAPYNDLEAIQKIIDAAGNELAAIIVEPVAANMGVILPESGVLEGLRSLADECGALLIFDEVITGFRFGPTTYGHLHGVRADLTTLGKIVGGGMPLAAVGGRAELMDALAPLGPVYQAGTLSGNPVAVAAGLATLQILERDNPYPCIEEMASALAKDLQQAATDSGTPLCCVQTASLFTPFFGLQTPPRHLADVKRNDGNAFAAFWREMLACGFYLPPSPFETAFVSTAHTPAHITAFIEAARDTFKQLQKTSEKG